QLLKIKDLCGQSEAAFLVNDRIDLVLAAGAAGVHLGQTDLPVETARRVLGETAIIGISTHTPQQFLSAQTSDVDYVAVGPIFPTLTKASEYEPLGLDFVYQNAAYKKRPLVAIGGIHLENALQVWRAGADSVAVVSDLANQQDPAARIKDYLDEWSRC
ncbi:MAG: thiamine phosphate synthase, partial [bacterium]